MSEIVFDLECDGFTPTKIHCLSAKSDKGLKSTTNYANMRKFFTNKDNIIICHNAKRFDVVVAEKLLGVSVTAKVVDTLALSWYLFPNRALHGLESWGEDFGVPKPKVTDWEGLSSEEYIHRCEEDVKINYKLWKKCWSYLLRLYGNEEGAWKLIDYLMFKMDCAREQERLRWKLDVPKCTEALERLSGLKEAKVIDLGKAMPPIPVVKARVKPAKPFKKDGSISAAGVKWNALLKAYSKPDDYDGEILEVTDLKDPNPGSHQQVKKWLESLGWIPATFKYKRDKETNEVKTIPQINLEHGAGICPSIKRLYDKEPALELLDGLSVLTHRISILKGFLSAVDEDGYVQAQIQGLTNTLRFKHKVVVNLPSVGKPYGGDIRGCLIAPHGYELIGSDMSSLEDRTKQHYMWDYDPDYVTEMNVEGFDPHLDIGVLSEMMTQEQSDAYKGGDKSLDHIRHNAKQVNYSCTYGVTPAGLVRNTGMYLDEATKLHTTYWRRNWSVQAIADACRVKTVNGQKWLYNPVSELYYSLRHEKDRFSTLNQGTGTYCFDMWVKEIMKSKLPIIGQMHDEYIGLIKVGLRDKATRVTKEAVRAVNKMLKLNRELDCDVAFGNNYAEIH